MTRVLSLLLFAALAPAQEPRFSSTLNLVRVDVQVTDPSGRIISGLTAADFAIFDDGQPQPIRNFAAESGPVDLLLVLDVSGSRRAQLSAIAPGGRFATASLRPGDRAGIVTFTSGARIVEELTVDFAQGEEALRTKLKTCCGTDIYGGIQTASKHFIALRDPHENEAPPRRALLVITDNVAFSLLRSKEKQTVREVWEADAVLNALVVPSNFTGRPPAMLREQ